MTAAAEARQILQMNAFEAGSDPASPAVARRLENAGAYSVLFYREPIRMLRAEGATMTADDGRVYLDFYNNVPSVGHCHPAVVEAVTRQIGTLNIHTRYVVDIVDDYVEALKARLPAALDKVILVCSGSEANDVAIRMARAATGGSGVVVTRNAYHGNTDLVMAASPSSVKGALRDWVEIVPEPSAEIHGTDIAGGFARDVTAAFARLAARGHAPAALLVDTIFSSDGVFAGPAGFLAPAVAAARATGAAFIADEVQPGFARTGDSFWGFGRHGLVPDIVTTGKPMGNGIPMAGVIAGSELVRAFVRDAGYFNTFGGNPVAAAAGLAVLRAIDEDGLLENSRTVGARLLSGISALAEKAPAIAAVRGAGLFLGVDIGHDGRPDPEAAKALIEGLRARGVLIGACGLYGATLKVRPPLCLSPAQADQFLAALADALDP